MNSQLMDNLQPTVSNWEPSLIGTYNFRTPSHPSLPDHKSAAHIFSTLEDQMNFFEMEHLLAVSELEQNYIFSDKYAVEDFLRSHRTLPQVLLAALPRLREHFGNIVFSLRAISDDYGWQTMYVDALWAGQAKDALEALERFEDAWWIANSSAAAGCLNFTYRLV